MGQQGSIGPRHRVRARRGRWVGIGLVSALAAGLLAGPAGASPARPSTSAELPSSLPGVLVPLRDGRDVGASTLVESRLPPSSAPQRLTPTPAKIIVTYHGFTSEAKASFQRAVDLWSRLVQSPVPIRIDATWKPLPSSVLGQAGAKTWIKDFPNAPRSGLYYPAALADAKAGTDLDPGRVDIVAEFNSSASWYLGLDGDAPSNRTDLVTVAMHEIGHGLGISGAYSSDGTRGYRSDDGVSQSSFDALVKTAGGTALSSYAHGSVSLGTALRSPLRFTGAPATAWYGGNPIPLYAPSAYEPGSSTYHLDEGTFAQGNANSLMTPYLNRGEAIYDPGEMTMGILRSIGWSTTGVATPPGAPTSLTASAGNGIANLTWKAPADTGRSRLTGYTINRYVGTSATPDLSIPAPVTSSKATVSGLTNGTSYRFTVSAVNGLGTGAASTSTGTVKPLSLGAFADADAFVDQQFRDVSGRAPNAFELAHWRQQITTGATTPAGVVVGIVRADDYRESVPPIIRLYKAYFKRLPDKGGLTYWIGKRRSGTTLIRASNTFAASSEFTRTYGSLSDSAFVTLVYQNVLGRAPDAGGRSYWISKLRSGTSRGTAMVGFSESSEYVRKMTSTVDAVAVHHSMLQAIPSDTIAATVARLDGDTPLETIVAEILASSAYLTRFGLGVPGSVSRPHAIAGDGEITVRWKAPAASGAPVTGYVVTPYKAGVAQPVVNVAAGVLTATLTGLDRSAPYAFTVASTSMFGTGEPSQMSETETPSAGSAPSTYQVNPRHDGRAPGSLATTPTVTWSKTFDDRLTYPVTGNGRVFAAVAGNGSGGYGTRLYAYDAATGGLAWGPVAIAGTYFITGLSFEDHKVFAISYDGQLTAFDEATGAVQWSVDLPGQYSFTSPPTSYRGILYTGGAGSGGTLYAVDEVDGTVLWTQSVANGDHSAPAVDANGVYVSYACAVAYRFAPQTGTRAWTHTTGCSGGGGKTPVLAGDRLYVRDSPTANTILNTANGQDVGTFTSKVAPAVDGGTRFEVASGTLQAIDIATGATKWTATGPSGTIVSAPIVLDDVVIVGTTSGAIIARDKVTGTIAWNVDAGAAIGSPDEQNAWNLTGMNVAGGRLFVSAGSRLVAIG